MQSLQDHFLIAMPAMADPNFNETVTYICKHDAEGAFGLAVTLKVRIPAEERARAEELVAAAHRVCPYSNATRNNIDVALEVI